MPNKRHGRPHHVHSVRSSKKSRTPGSRRNYLDYVVYFFSIATPLFELPQAFTIYHNHSAADVSIATWGFFLLDNIVWIIYAATRRIVPLLVSTILYLLIELLIVVGILLYS